MVTDTCHILAHPVLLPLAARVSPSRVRSLPAAFSIFILYLPARPIPQGPQRFSSALHHPSSPWLFFYFLIPFYTLLQIFPTAFAFIPHFHLPLFSFLFKDPAQYSSSLLLQHLPTRHLRSSHDPC